MEVVFCYSTFVRQFLKVYEMDLRKICHNR